MNASHVRLSLFQLNRIIASLISLKRSNSTSTTHSLNALREEEQKKKKKKKVFGDAWNVAISTGITRVDQHTTSTKNTHNQHTDTTIATEHHRVEARAAQPDCTRQHCDARRY
jgi:hypothetical protein